MREYVPLPLEYLEEMVGLTDEEFGALIRGLLSMNCTGEEPSSLPGNSPLFWPRVKNRDGRYRKSFEDEAARRSAAGKAGASARWGRDATASDRIRPDQIAMRRNAIDGKTETKTKTKTETETETETKTKREGVKGAPALDEVKRYCVEEGLAEETALAFYDYYEARGWIVSGQPVKSWEALLRSWVRRDKPQVQGGYDYASSEGMSL